MGAVPEPPRLEDDDSPPGREGVDNKEAVATDEGATGAAAVAPEVPRKGFRNAPA
jgi:hypothetical protein